LNWGSDVPPLSHDQWLIFCISKSEFFEPPAFSAIVRPQNLS